VVALLALPAMTCGGLASVPSPSGTGAADAGQDAATQGQGGSMGDDAGPPGGWLDGAPTPVGDPPDGRREVDGAGGAGGGASLGPVGLLCAPGASYGDPLPADARATTIHSGFREAEGPVWVPAQKALFVSDIDEHDLGNGSLYRFTPATGQWEVVASKVGSNGLALDVDGRIVAACHDVPALYRFDPLTAMRTLIPGTDSFEGKPFNEPNDVVVRNDGNIYFTDPKVQPGAKGRAGQGVTAYYRVSPRGAVSRIAAGSQPNGIALSPDGRFLYVTGGFPLRRHDVASDGTVASAFVEIGSGGGDGMGVDCAGNLYLTVGGGVRVVSAQGKALGNIAVPSAGFITNVAFGGDDRQTLFITTRYAVHQLRVNVPGFPN
jgi:gluconolactonase